MMSYRAKRRIITEHGVREAGDLVPEADGWAPQALRANLNTGRLERVFVADDEMSAASAPKKASKKALPTVTV